MSLGNTLRALRKRERYSQEGIASFLQVSHSLISLWERDVRIPDYTYLRRLAKIFGVSYEYLVNLAAGIKPADKAVYLDEYLLRFPPDVAKFLTCKESKAYIVAAKSVADEGLSPEAIRWLTEFVRREFRGQHQSGEEGASEHWVADVPR